MKMAYMRADSGSLMAIAQQVIQQKHQQQQTYHQQHQISVVYAFSPHPTPPISGRFAFSFLDSLPVPDVSDSGPTLFFPPLDHTSAFRLSNLASASGAFDSNEWMESPMGESTESFNLPSACDSSWPTVAPHDLSSILPPPDPFPFDLIPAGPGPSDLNHIIFSDSQKNSTPVAPPLIEPQTWPINNPPPALLADLDLGSGPERGKKKRLLDLDLNFPPRPEIA